MDYNFTNYGQTPQQRPPKRQSQMTRQQYINKRKRRRRAMMLRFFAVLAILLVVAGIIIGAVFLFKGKSYSGTFEREADISDRICGDIAVWLCDIDDSEIDTSWVKSRTEPYTVKEIIELSAENSGYSRHIDQDSYAKLTAKVNADLDKLLTEIIRDKLVQKGYKEEMTDEETSDIVKQVLGMSASEYLSANGISLVPAIEDLSSSILGSEAGENGTYKIHGSKIDLTINGNTQSEPIMKKKGTLVFTESGKVYNEKQ